MMVTRSRRIVPIETVSTETGTVFQFQFGIGPGAGTRFDRVEFSTWNSFSELLERSELSERFFQYMLKLIIVYYVNHPSRNHRTVSPTIPQPVPFQHIVLPFRTSVP